MMAKVSTFSCKNWPYKKKHLVLVYYCLMNLRPDWPVVVLDLMAGPAWVFVRVDLISESKSCLLDLTWGNVGSPYECDVPWPKTNRRGMFLCNRITGQPACILYNNNMYIRLTTCVRYCIVKPQLRSRANFKDLIRTWTETS